MDQEIANAVEVLKKGGIILYPTDTIWGIGCDANNKEAVNKIFTLKKRAKSKALIILIAEYTNLYKLMLQVPPSAFNEMHNKLPTTIIFDNVNNICKEILANDGSAAIRLVKDKFCQEIIFNLGNPIISTSANISGQKNPIEFNEINKELINSVDYVVNLRKDQIMETPSRIIKMGANGEIIKIR
jgi:L-threonylcarbamoyladenylate synthase